MKTRVYDFLDTSKKPWAPVYSFQFSTDKHPTEASWRHVDRGDGWVATWDSSARRDQARACFRHRRSASEALADLRRAGLLTTSPGAHQ